MMCDQASASEFRRRSTACQINRAWGWGRGCVFSYACFRTTGTRLAICLIWLVYLFALNETRLDSSISDGLVNIPGIHV
jgi:hypothetical protein